jgi:hypothetical protein
VRGSLDAGLFVADEKLQDDDSRFTRQNPNGNRCVVVRSSSP